MKNEILFGIGGVIIGAVISGALILNMNMPAMEHVAHDTTVTQDDHSHDDHSMTMEDMTHALDGKTGEEFDKEFLIQMIPHHQGAVEMAELALENAEHQEIKDMAQSIIDSQNQEIKMMQDWQEMWGY
jgi:uncharacterized protein (DUF305 family)